MTNERYLRCSRKYPVPLFAGAWAARGGKKEAEEEEGVKGAGNGEGVVVLAGGGGNGRNGVPNSLLLARYDFASTELTDALDTLSTGGDPPFRVVVHPGGEGLVCSFEKDCRLFEVRREEGGDVKVVAQEREIQALQAVGEQNCLVFSADGTRLAAGGDDGHLRVVEWPSFKVLLDQPGAHRSIKDLDFSLDAAFMASTSDDSGCRIWDLASGSSVTTLPSVKGEGLGFVRFSRDGTKPFMYVTVRKGGMGFVSTFDTSSWKMVKSRKVEKETISAFAITRDSRFLAIGSTEGDISIIDAATLSVHQKLKRAHMIFVTCMEFSPSGRALLSVSADSSARVTAIEAVRGGSWHGSLLLFVIFLLSMFVVIVGNGLLTDSQHDQSPATLLSSFLARLNSSSLSKLADHDNA